MFRAAAMSVIPANWFNRPVPQPTHNIDRRVDGGLGSTQVY